MYEIVALFLFVIAVVLAAYIWYLKRERSVLLREIEVRAEKRLHACMKAYLKRF